MQPVTLGASGRRVAGDSAVTSARKRKSFSCAKSSSCIIVVSIYNLTQGRGDSNLWTALLSSCLGYLLPNPSMKRDGIARLLPDAA